jgi:biotin carboxyl carrier protein
MILASTNSKNFELKNINDGFEVNGETISLDMASLGNGLYHILHGHKSYRAEILEIDVDAKTFVIKVNNHIHTVNLKDKRDLLMEKMGINASQSDKINVIKAPMPGLIIDLKVKAGDIVKTGDPILILEAMKMENVIKSPGDGEIKTINIQKGDRVEKNQVLISF